MKNNQIWMPFSWHCVNCGTIVTGYQNNAGNIKVECPRCHSVMIRTQKTPSQDLIRVFAPAQTARV